MGVRNESGRTLFVREQVVTVLGAGLIVYEAGYEHSSSPIVYGVALVLYGFIPFSLVDRWVGRLGGDRDHPSHSEHR